MGGVKRMNVSTEHVPARWGFWLRWVLASIMAGTIGLALGDFPSGVGFLLRGTDMSDESGWTDGWAVIVAGILVGMVFGAMQWLILRQKIGRLRWWFPASVVGFAVGFPVVWSIGGSGGGSEYAHHALPHVLDPSGTLGGAIIGFLVGLAQWLVLRRKLSRAVWWVPASIVGFVLGWLAAVAGPADGPGAHFIGGLAFGATLGAITGSVLVWLLRRPALEA